LVTRARSRQVPRRDRRQGHPIPAAQEENRTVAPRSLNRPAEVVDTIPNIDHRYGDGRAEILGIALLNEEGERVHLVQPNSKLIVRISVRARQDVAMPVVGFMMRNHLGVDFSGTNTAREEGAR